GITNVTITETQKEYEESPNVHGVRLDVYSEDSDNRAYDIEMQAMNKGNLRKRSRYNQSMMDRQQLIKSMDYSELKDSFVIFICNFDLFGQNRYVYVFENRCKDEPNLKLEDGMTKVFINAKGTVGDITPELKKFLKMVSRHEATDDFTRRLQEIIDFFHMDDNTRDSYMTLEMKILEETKYARKIALEEGLERGLEQGLEQGKLLEIISCVKDGLFSEEVGAKRAGLSLEEFKKHLTN
ncbi:MAG: Rpn family recombination-promoting nuclease/putative transposase, partial [Eubacterium sp.]|nr:Rpn family recombination-promoting nuclease/putative transposase [Eubacterium sp.]